MSSFMRNSGPTGPPPSVQATITSLNTTVRDIQSQLTSLTNTITALASRMDAQHASLRDGVVAAAAVISTVTTRVGDLEHAAACINANGEIPERGEDDDVVGRVLAAMDTHNVPVTPELNTVQKTEPTVAAQLTGKQSVPDASLPPPPPPPPVFNRPANATGAMLSGVRRRKWGVA